MNDGKAEESISNARGHLLHLIDILEGRTKPDTRRTTPSRRRIA